MSKVDEVLKAFLEDHNNPMIPKPEYADIMEASSDICMSMMMLHGSVIAGDPCKEHAIDMVHHSICFLAEYFE